MFEVAHAGEDHCDVVLVGCGDHFFVAHRAARLNDRRHASLRRFINAVAEGEESVGGHHRSRQRQLRFHRANLH